MNDEIRYKEKSIMIDVYDDVPIERGINTVDEESIKTSHWQMDVYDEDSLLIDMIDAEYTKKLLCFLLSFKEIKTNMDLDQFVLSNAMITHGDHTEYCKTWVQNVSDSSAVYAFKGDIALYLWDFCVGGKKLREWNYIHMSKMLGMKIEADDVIKNWGLSNNLGQVVTLIFEEAVDPEDWGGIKTLSKAAVFLCRELDQQEYVKVILNRMFGGNPPVHTSGYVDTDFAQENGCCRIASIVQPSYYSVGRKYEPIDVIEFLELDFNLGNVIKYISRAGRKGYAFDDLSKAYWYLEREIEKRKKENDYEQN